MTVRTPPASTKNHRHPRSAGCVHCPMPGCEWYATFRDAEPDRIRAAELRRDKHFIEKHNLRLALS